MVVTPTSAANLAGSIHHPLDQLRVLLRQVLHSLDVNLVAHNEDGLVCKEGLDGVEEGRLLTQAVAALLAHVKHVDHGSTQVGKRRDTLGGEGGRTGGSDDMQMVGQGPTRARSHLSMQRCDWRLIVIFLSLASFHCITVRGFRTDSGPIHKSHAIHRLPSHYPNPHFTHIHKNSLRSDTLSLLHVGSLVISWLAHLATVCCKV